MQAAAERFSWPSLVAFLPLPKKKKNVNEKCPTLHQSPFCPVGMPADSSLVTSTREQIPDLGASVGI